VTPVPAAPEALPPPPPSVDPDDIPGVPDINHENKVSLIKPKETSYCEYDKLFRFPFHKMNVSTS
jgi:hypothetical protein